MIRFVTLVMEHAVMDHQLRSTKRSAMKTILHATDFSAQSVPALKLAHALSEASSSTLVVLHVFDVPMIVSSPQRSDTMQLIGKDLHKLEKVRLENFCKEHLGEVNMKHIRCKVKENEVPATAIMGVADDIDADTVIVGTRGESRVRELLMGSTAKKLLKESARPVLVVPAGALTNAPEQVAQAVMIGDADVGAIERGIRFCDELGARLTVVHVGDAKDGMAARSLDQLMTRVKENTGRKDLRHELVHVGDVTIAEALDRYLHKHKIDLLVMLGRRHHNVLDMLFGSDVIIGMAFHTRVPTLVLREG